MTETREPKPYHPPQAYEPPAGAAGAAAAEAGKPAKGTKAEKAAGSKTTQSEDVKPAGAGKAASVADEAESADAGSNGSKPVAKSAAKGSTADPRNAVKAPPRVPGQSGSKPAAGALKKGAPKASQAVRTAPQEAGKPSGAAGSVPGPAAPQGAAPRPAARPAPRSRTARLRVAKADPWSVMKVSFLLSIALGICTIVAAAVLWTVMDAMGVFSTVGGTISDATTSSDGGGFDLQSFLSLPHTLLFTSVIAVINVVLATALATLGAFVYNLSAGFVGGVELTLAEDE
ncbi:DUF3566 domain-containing protein [Streptomyces sp. URMC 127]|uniref:DUF3566 domain-containing protein n=1 Tax=Streptomyces sp. URMC 127 TaxID=3423402 RepID=UPI003F1ADD59